jgi:hypothetical protein
MTMVNKRLQIILTAFRYLAVRFWESQGICVSKQQLSFALGAAVAALSTAACSSSADSRMVANSGVRTAAATTGATMGDQHSISERFADLDQYLLWLKKFEAPADGPWYKEIRPGVYELQTGGNLHLDVPSNEQRVFTREELEKKFGFRK